MANSLQRHKTADAVKWFVTFVILLGVIASVVTLFIQVDRNTTVTQIGAEAYKIAALDDSGEETESDKSIVTRDAFTTDGLKIELADDAAVSYELYFYDADGEFVSKTGALTADYDGSTVPETAATVKVVITPTEDEDGKVTLTEVFGYASALTITVNR